MDVPTDDSLRNGAGGAGRGTVRLAAAVAPDDLAGTGVTTPGDHKCKSKSNTVLAADATATASADGVTMRVGGPAGKLTSAGMGRDDADTRRNGAGGAMAPHPAPLPDPLDDGDATLDDAAPMGVGMTTAEPEDDDGDDAPPKSVTVPSVLLLPVSSLSPSSSSTYEPPTSSAPMAAMRFLADSADNRDGREDRVGAPTPAPAAAKYDSPPSAAASVEARCTWRRRFDTPWSTAGAATPDPNDRP